MTAIPAHTTRRRRNLAALAGLATAAFVGLTFAPALAVGAPAGVGSSPPLPTIGQYSSLASAPLTGDELQRHQKRQAQAAAFYSAMSTRNASAEATATAALNLAEPYQKQINEDYCGAATTVMVADDLHVGWSGTATTQQTAAGHLLNTTDAGTAWYGADNVPSYPGTSWYPVEDVLNYELYTHSKGEWYVATPVSGTPTASQQTVFKQFLVQDIADGYPEADNQYSIPNYQLPYQPNGTWYHWWSARGYKSSGAQTGINDPAQWANGVEHWVTTNGGAHTVVTALGGRGYIS
jgi:hypothetical protein